VSCCELLRAVLAYLPLTEVDKQRMLAAHARSSTSPAPAINMFSNAQTRVADCSTL
jgi:hypothetical protein